MLLFLGTTTWIGFEWSSQLGKRPLHIKQLKNALQILEAEMLYSQVPLQEAFKLISMQVPEPTQHLFASLYEQLKKKSVDFTEVWDQAVLQFMEQSALEKNEKEILTQFGRTLGQYDFHQQQKYIVIAMSHLDRELDVAEDNKLKYGKMAKTIGFLCGLFVVILLI